MSYLEVNVASLAAGPTIGTTVAFNANVAASSYSTSYTSSPSDPDPLGRARKGFIMSMKKFL